MKVLILGKGVGTPSAWPVCPRTRAGDMNAGATRRAGHHDGRVRRQRRSPGSNRSHSLEHADRLDRIHPLRRQHRLASSRTILDSLERRSSSRFSRSRRFRCGWCSSSTTCTSRTGTTRAFPTNLRPASNFGYAWSFATIWPAIFEAADLIDVWRGSSGALPATAGTGPRRPWLDRAALIVAWRGHAALAADLAIALPGGARLARIHPAARSDQRDISAPSRSSPTPATAATDRLINLIAERLPVRRPVGILELLGRARNGTTPCRSWRHLKIFEMPVPGYFGFPAFALECFTMYVVRARG